MCNYMANKDTTIVDTQQAASHAKMRSRGAVSHHPISYISIIYTRYFHRAGVRGYILEPMLLTLSRDEADLFDSDLVFRTQT